MTFVSKQIVGSGEEYKLVGDLTLNGITKPVELDVEFFGTSVFPADQSTRAGFSATGSLSRKDYGIEFNMALGGDKVMISDKVALDLDVQLVAAHRLTRPSRTPPDEVVHRCAAPMHDLRVVSVRPRVIPYISPSGSQISSSRSPSGPAK